MGDLPREQARRPTTIPWPMPRHHQEARRRGRLGQTRPRRHRHPHQRPRPCPGGQPARRALRRLPISRRLLRLPLAHARLHGHPQDRHVQRPRPLRRLRPAARVSLDRLPCSRDGDWAVHNRMERRRDQVDARAAAKSTTRTSSTPSTPSSTPPRNSPPIPSPS